MRCITEGRCVCIKRMKCKKAGWILTGTMLFASSATFTGAYLTYTTPVLTNRMETGSAAVQVQEPGWEKDSKMAMLPGESRTKNPMAKNTGTLTSWIFLEVENPVRSISVVDAETGRKLPENETELFTFQIQDGWELVETERETNGMRYVYGWKEPVAPMQETGTLFEKITIVPYLEGSLDEREVLDIPVTAKAIQKSALPEEENLETIYQIYLKQQAEEMSMRTTKEEDTLVPEAERQNVLENETRKEIRQKQNGGEQNR